MNVFDGVVYASSSHWVMGQATHCSNGSCWEVAVTLVWRGGRQQPRCLECSYRSATGEKRNDHYPVPV